MKSKYILFFIASFFCSLFVFILCAKFGLTGGIGLLSWREIFENIHKFLVMSCWGAILLTFGYFLNKYDKYDKKRK